MWFTADTHFGHSNIIELTHRPFSSVQEMDRRLIANINDRVSARDSLYILGDFSFRLAIRIIDFLHVDGGNNVETGFFCHGITF